MVLEIDNDFDDIFKTKKNDETVAATVQSKKILEQVRGRILIEIKAGELFSDGATFIEQTGDGLIYWEFAAANEEHVTGGNFRIPKDFEGKSLAVKIYTIPLGGSSGDVKFRLDMERRRSAVAGRVQELGTYQLLTFPGDTTIQETTFIFDSLALKENDIVGMDFHRKGDDGADDYTGVTGLIAIFVETL